MKASQKTTKTTRAKAATKAKATPRKATKVNKSEKTTKQNKTKPQPEPQPEPVPKEQPQGTEKRVTKKKRTRYFETYISKVLKQVAAENGITSNAKQQLNSSLCVVARNLAGMVRQLTYISNKKTMSDKEVFNATRLLLPGSLGDRAMSHAQSSLEKFNTEETKHSARQQKAGILFPPSITEKFLRDFDFSKMMVTRLAPVYFAAVLEYLASYLLERSSALANGEKHIRITIRDLELSVRQDSELTLLWERCNLSFIGGGVVPNIHPSLLVKKPRKKRKAAGDKSAPTKKGGHRFRPGTVSLREIRKFQKTSNCLTFAKYPFERFVRSLVNSHRPDMKISKYVFIVLQYYVEQFVVDFLRDANAAAIHSGRVKLMPADLTFVNALRHYPELDPEPYRVEKEATAEESAAAPAEVTEEVSEEELVDETA